MSIGHVFVAMSGGVDSSVAAVLLQQAGYQLSGVNLRMFHNEDLGESPSRTCCSLSDAEDAALVARRLGFPFYVFDFAQTFRDTVIRNFIEEYQQGRTPNPVRSVTAPSSSAPCCSGSGPWAATIWPPATMPGWSGTKPRAGIS